MEIVRNLSFFTLLFLSFTFSGYETAFFSGGESLREKDRLLKRLKKDKTGLLNTLLLMNLIVNIANSFLFAAITEKFITEFLHSQILKTMAQIGGFFLILLLTGEITPKVLAIRKPSFFLENFTWLIFPFYLLLSPFLKPLSALVNWVFKKPVYPENALLSELKQLFPKNLPVFISIAMFKSKIKRIYTPKKEVIGFKEVPKEEELIEKALLYPHTYYPLIQDEMNVIGILSLKDSSPGEMRILNPEYIHDIRTISEFVKRSIEEDKYFYVVIGEHGEFKGVISLNDVIKILQNEPEIHQIDAQHLKVEGYTHLEDLEQYVNVQFPIHTQTLWGYLYAKLNRFPEIGEEIEDGELIFKIIQENEGMKIEVRKKK